MEKQSESTNRIDKFIQFLAIEIILNLNTEKHEKDFRTKYETIHNYAELIIDTAITCKRLSGGQSCQSKFPEDLL